MNGTEEHQNAVDVVRLWEWKLFLSIPLNYALGCQKKITTEFSGYKLSFSHTNTNNFKIYWTAGWFANAVAWGTSMLQRMTKLHISFRIYIYLSSLALTFSVSMYLCIYLFISLPLLNSLLLDFFIYIDIGYANPTIFERNLSEYAIV